MLLSVANKKEIDISAKKTKPTQENEEISNDKKSTEKEMQLFKYKATENNIKEESNNNNNKRVDKYGNPIVKKGKHRVTFIDKVTTRKFEDVIKIESFKDYNKTEEVKSKNAFNTCCFLV